MGKLSSSTPVSNALNLRRGDRIALTGAGGKTTLLYTLAEENFFGHGLFTTTTKMFNPAGSVHPFQKIIEISGSTGSAEPMMQAERGSCFVSSGPGPAHPGKVIGLSNKTIENWKCLKEWPILVVEADGAAQKPLKAPCDGEPVIPGCINKVAGCIGLDSLGKVLSSEWVHRCELFRERFCSPGQKKIVPETFRQLIIHPLGLFRNAPEGVEKWVILNKMDRLDGEYRLSDLLNYLKREIPNIRILAAKLGPFQAEQNSPVLY